MASGDPQSSGPRFKLSLRGRDIWLTPGRYVLGRSVMSHIVLDDALVSRAHATLAVTHDAVVLEDLGSINGTFVNGERVTRGQRELRPGDRVTLGGEDLVMAMALHGERTPRAAADTFIGDDAVVPGAEEDDETTARGPAAKPTEKRDAFALLGEIAERAIAAGHPQDAESVLGNHIRSVVAGAERGKQDAARTASAILWALRLAEACRATRWLDAAITLLETTGRPPELHPLRALGRAVSACAPEGTQRLARYAALLRAGTSAFEVHEIAAVDAVEELLVRSTAPRHGRG